MNTKKILTFLLAGSLGFTMFMAPAVTAEAAPASVSEYNSVISSLNSKENQLAQKVDSIQKSMKENEEESEVLVAEMKATETELSELREEIEDLKVAIENREVLLEEQARALQIVGESGNVVNFVLQAESLSEVVGRVDVVNKLITSNKQTMDKQEEDKALVEGKEEETLEKQEEQMKTAAKLESNKALLEEQKAEQESLLAEVAAEKAVAQEERDALIAQARAAEQRRKDLEAARNASVVVASSNSASNSSSNSSSDAQPVSVATSSVSAAPAPAAPAANNGSLLGVAHSLTGVGYHYGGTTTAGFDCSGYTSYVFNQAGRSIPRTAAGQYAGTSSVSRAEAQPGDLVFFRQGGGIDHVGIYLGGGRFIGSQSHTGVAVASLDSGYWANYVVGFGR